MQIDSIILANCLLQFLPQIHLSNLYLQFLILLLTFLGISNAKPAISNRGKDPFNGPPKPFSFKYGVTDEETGSNFDHAQQQDSNGVVTGKIF